MRVEKGKEGNECCREAEIKMREENWDQRALNHSGECSTSEIDVLFRLHKKNMTEGIKTLASIDMALFQVPG